MTHEERIQHIRSFILSPAWKEIIEPAYRAKLQVAINGLVGSEGEEEEVQRGLIGVLRWALDLPASIAERRENKRRKGRVRGLHDLLTWPISEVLEDVAAKEREQADAADQARWSHFAEYGFHSPVPLPEPDDAERP